MSSATQMRPDPTFYASAKLAMEASRDVPKITACRKNSCSVVALGSTLAKAN